MTHAAVTLDADQIDAIEAGGEALLRAGDTDRALKLLSLHLLARALAGEDYSVKVSAPFSADPGTSAAAGGSWGASNQGSGWPDCGPLRVIEGGR